MAFQPLAGKNRPFEAGIVLCSRPPPDRVRKPIVNSGRPLAFDNMGRNSIIGFVASLIASGANAAVGTKRNL